MKRNFKKPDLNKNEANFVLLRKSWHPDVIKGLFSHISIPHSN